MKKETLATKSDIVSVINMEDIKRLQQYKVELINLAINEPPRWNKVYQNGKIRKGPAKKPIVDALLREAREIEKYIYSKLINHESLLSY